MFRLPIFIFLILQLTFGLYSQQLDYNKPWHNQKRVLRYTPENNNFVIINGNKRFTRALYGTHTAFRAETGDLPEFALYMPGMGGNIHFGLKSTQNSKWLNTSQKIIARYKPGKMMYEISDSLLGNGKLFIEILALHNAEGLIIKIWGENINSSVNLLSVYGGASNKRFSRNGDIGADPESSFYLKPENCITNQYSLNNTRFNLLFGSPDTLKCRKITGIFPLNSLVKLADANKINHIDSLINSGKTNSPVIISLSNINNNQPLFIALKNAENADKLDYTLLPQLFVDAEEYFNELANRIKIHTPDAYINNFGAALSIAADAIWDGTSFQHGAVAWRIPLNGWRGAYVADPLGWSDRAKTHFREYLKAQYLEPDSGPTVPDFEKNMARQQEIKGVSLYTSGYISRNPGKISSPHHYDMNLVFFDQLLSHLLWTGDTAFLRETWPAIERHIAWEKRNFDHDSDGLYDAYCCIWASDALQYSGGGVTHSSAYNYRANKLAADIAPLINKDPIPYKMEAEKIIKAIQTKLWLKSKGWYAEYIDQMGSKLIHPNAGLWTIYHTMDSEIPDPFEAYQTLRYIDNNIPHIPIIADGLEPQYYMLATTNWMPYTWSVNNVVIAEMYHTALAYWQGGRPDEAFRIWKSNILESMYLGSGPGNFTQISFYDAFRGELYRDFADPIGMAARSLVEGLFGIKPNTLSGELIINPGFPDEWNFAGIEIPNIKITYQKKKNSETYSIIPGFTKPLKLKLFTEAKKDGIKAVIINGEKILWNCVESSIGKPKIELNFQPSDSFNIEILWEGATPDSYKPVITLNSTDSIKINTGNAIILDVYDPQEILLKADIQGNVLFAGKKNVTGDKNLFLKVEQNQMSWWVPVFLKINRDSNNTPTITERETNNKTYTTIDISEHFNDRVTQIFKNKYLHPRPSSPTLQLPTQGIGNWCYPNVSANIDDSGLRNLAGVNGLITLPNGIPFKTTGDSIRKNIIYTSQWENYPAKVDISLSGRANKAYLLMAGSTNPMQSRITNGMIEIEYTDGSVSSLELVNPETWWPIEQDYFVDDFAFYLNAPKPWRVHLKTGLITKDFNRYSSIKGFTTTAIDGGAATVYEMPLNSLKKLKKLTVKAVANDVVIGLMGITLEKTNKK